MSLPLTPSQTVGPYLHIALPSPEWPYAVPEGTPGAFWLRGCLYDGNGDPVPDGMVETWQADPEGRFNHPDDPRGAVPGPDGFRAFGRSDTGPTGEWAIYTLKPGRVPTEDDGLLQAPHINVSVFCRGLLNRVVTRIYFPDEEEANRADPVLQSITDPARRETLVASTAPDGYRFDIRLQGDHETVFFAI